VICPSPLDASAADQENNLTMQIAQNRTSLYSPEVGLIRDATALHTPCFVLNQ